MFGREDLNSNQQQQSQQQWTGLPPPPPVSQVPISSDSHNSQGQQKRTKAGAIQKLGKLPFPFKMGGLFLVLLVLGKGCQFISSLGDTPQPRFIGQGTPSVRASAQQEQREETPPDRAAQSRIEADQLFNACTAARASSQIAIADTYQKFLVERALRWQQFALQQCEADPSCRSEYDWLLNLRAVEAERLKSLTPRGTLNPRDTDVSEEYVNQLRVILEIDQAISQGWSATPTKPLSVTSVEEELDNVERRCREYQNYLSIDDLERVRETRGDNR